MQSDQIFALNLIGAILCLFAIKMALRSWTAFERQAHTLKQELSFLGRIVPISVSTISVISAVIFGKQFLPLLSGFTSGKKILFVFFPIFGSVLFMTWLVNTIALKTPWIRDKLTKKARYFYYLTVTIWPESDGGGKQLIIGPYPTEEKRELATKKIKDAFIHIFDDQVPLRFGGFSGYSSKQEHSEQDLLDLTEKMLQEAVAHAPH